MKIILLFIVLYSAAVIAQNNSIDYFGQTLPGDSAVVFAPGLVALEDRPEYSIAFSTAGDEVCISTLSNFNGRIFLNSTILYSKLTGSGWTKLDTASFISNGDGGDITFSPDGQLLTFSKSNPLPEWAHNTDLYYCTRTDTGWSQPQPFPKVINSEFREAGHAWATDRTLYFSTGRPKDKGCDVYRININGTDTFAEYVPNLSTGADEDGVWISPDESYAIIESQHDLHYKDLYISFRKEDDSWTKLKNMGPKINFLPFQVRGRVSADGKYLFYTGFDGKEFDIYWIRADKIIADLKKEVHDTN